MLEADDADATGQHGTDRADAGDPSVAVALAVADRDGRAPTDLPPLHDVVDADALDALVGGPGGVDGTVTFTYCGYVVTVHGTGAVSVEG